MKKIKKSKSQFDSMVQHNQMFEALEYYKNGINHFYDCINFGRSNLDAKAIEFMNESNIKITNAYNNSK